jgi:hypothetical protein
MKRRAFFKLIAGAALSPVASKMAIALPSVPVLYGDGEHDDTHALQALLDGDVVEFAYPEMAKGAGWVDDVFTMPQGMFRTTETIIFNNMRGKISGYGAHVIGDHDDAVMHFSSSCVVGVEGFHITGRFKSPALWFS